MSEHVHRIKAGSLVRCRETDRIGCVLKTYLTDKDFMCQISWGSGELSYLPALDVECLDADY